MKFTKEVTPAWCFPVKTIKHEFEYCTSSNSSLFPSDRRQTGLGLRSRTSRRRRCRCCRCSSHQEQKLDVVFDLVVAFVLLIVVVVIVDSFYYFPEELCNCARKNWSIKLLIVSWFCLHFSVKFQQVFWLQQRDSPLALYSNWMNPKGKLQRKQVGWIPFFVKIINSFVSNSKYRAFAMVIYFI